VSRGSSRPHDAPGWERGRAFLTAGGDACRGTRPLPCFRVCPAPRSSAFRTGDVAVVTDGYYRILGRRSVDIIETGGFKVSALEIEEVLRLHRAIAECAVVGVEDDTWGERVSVAVEARGGATVCSPAGSAEDFSAAPHRVTIGSVTLALEDRMLVSNAGCGCPDCCCGDCCGADCCCDDCCS
jgi:acyl-CoA synthetase (AMP-forming)/AMP-acid ligase II